jgi:hypothetical protein
MKNKTISKETFSKAFGVEVGKVIELGRSSFLYNGCFYYVAKNCRDDLDGLAHQVGSLKIWQEWK